MLIKRIHRGGSPAGRLYALLVLATALVAIALLFALSAPGSHAQVTGTCTVVPGQTVATCTFTAGAATTTTGSTTPAVAVVDPGGTMTISLTNPAGAFFTAPYISGLPNGCTLQPVIPPYQTLSVSCAVASLGIPAGTSLTETITVASSAAAAQNVQFVTQTVTFNANGAAIGLLPPTSVPTASAVLGSCTGTGTPPTNPWTCTNTPADVTVAGENLTLTVTAPTGQTATVTTAPSVVGNCPLVTPLPTSSAFSASVTYVCGPGEQAPSTQILLMVTTSGGGMPAEVTTANASGINSGLAGTEPGTCTSLSASQPTGSCTNTASAAATVGETLELSITAAAGQTIAVVPNPYVGSCPLSSPPSPPATAAGGTVVVDYSCGPGQSTGSSPSAVMLPVTDTNAAPGTPSEVTGVGVGAGSGIPCVPALSTIGSTSLCSNTPGVAAYAGGTLSLTVSAAPGQTIFVPSGGAPPFAGGCPLTTALPTSVSYPGGPVTVTYTCDAAQATGTGAFVVVVQDQNGVPGTPTEITTVAGVNVTTGVSAPTTETVTFTVNAGATPVGIQVPVVTLTASTKDTSVEQTVTFTATATTANANATITGFSFNFGDGYGPVGAAPVSSDATSSVTQTHTYPANGVFQVTAQAMDSTGQIGSATTTVGVRPTVSYLGLYQGLPPNEAAAGTSIAVNLSASPTVTGPGQAVTFTYTAATEVNQGLAFGYTLPGSNTGAAPASLKLDFGDGTPPQLVQPKQMPTHDYASPGSYIATLTATDNLGNVGHASVQVIITSPVLQPPANVGFDQAPSSATTGTPVGFSANNATTAASCGTIKSYTWDFGDNSGPVTGQVVTHTYTTAGSYTVTLTAADCEGATASTTTPITVAAGS